MKAPTIIFLSESEMEVKFQEAKMDERLKVCNFKRIDGDPLEDDQSREIIKSKREWSYTYRDPNSRELVAWVVHWKDASGEEHRSIRYLLIEGIAYRVKSPH
jgi:hypothetical protein